MLAEFSAIRSYRDKSERLPRALRKTSDATTRKHVSKDALLEHIKAIHTKTDQEYGWFRIWQALWARGIPQGKKRVRKLMQLHRIKARARRKYKATTDSTQPANCTKPAPQQSAANQPNRVRLWTGP